jgi:hypothetical protein
MKTTTQTILGIIALILIVVGIVLTANKKHEPVAELTSPATGFTWRYEKGEEDLDGLPKTQIFLEVVYENGKATSTKIDEVQGSCNDIDPKSEDEDRVDGSTKIQCYAAGLGEWYKVVKGAQSYEVMRKNFVEAEPDSVPPEYQYEVVAEAPLLQ